MAKSIGNIREIAVAVRELEAFAATCRGTEIDRTRRHAIAALRRRRRSLVLAQRKQVTRRARKLEHVIAEALPALAGSALETRDPALHRFLVHRVAAAKVKAIRRTRALAPQQRGDNPPYKELHRIRVRIKHWRYAVEIALRASPDDRVARALLVRLRRLQDAGGKTQDWADLMDIVGAQLRTLRQSHAAGGPALLSRIRLGRRRAATSFVRALRAHLGNNGRSRQKS
jgi:CHAD domain-containing protein